jgi:hypothetical protein
LNVNDFEQKLQRQPLRPIPCEWREEILSAASKAGTARRAVRGRLGEASLPNWLSTINSRISTLLWPHPKAWAGLAVVWILIFAVNFSTRDASPVVAEKNSQPSPEVIVELRQQRLLLAELMGPRDKSDADRSKPLAPQPRSEGRFEILTT